MQVDLYNIRASSLVAVSPQTTHSTYTVINQYMHLRGGVMAGLTRRYHIIFTEVDQTRGVH